MLKFIFRFRVIMVGIKFLLFMILIPILGFLSDLTSFIKELSILTKILKGTSESLIIENICKNILLFKK